MEIPVTWFIIVALFLIFEFIGIHWWRKNRHLPPGPLGLPFFGYYPFLGSRPYVLFNEQVSRYGDVQSIRTIGGKLIVVLNSFDVIKEVFQTRADEFGGRPKEFNFLSWIDDGLGIAQEEGSVWKEHKRFFIAKAKGFGFGKTETEGHIQDLIAKLIADIKEHNGSPFTLFPKISPLATNVISQILFKKQFQVSDKRYQILISGLRNLFRIFVGNSLFIVGPYLKYGLIKLTSVGRDCEKTRKVLVNTAKDIVDDHVQTFDHRNVRDFVDCYLEHRNKLEEKGQLHGSSFTMERLTAITLNMLMEGTESVSATISMHLKSICMYPEVQRKVQEELDSVIGRNRLPCWEDKPKLPYFDAVLLEVYRCHQEFNFSAYYSNYEECQLRGYQIPKRSIIIANFWSVRHDPKLFPEPETFNPERFLGSDKKKSIGEGSIPFGLGKRFCLGESLAQMEVFLVVASVLQNFNLYPGGDEKVIAIFRTNN